MNSDGANAVIAVYRDGATSDAVAAEVRRRDPSADVRVDDPHDRLAALDAETREETENALIAPQASFVFTKEMLKSMAVLVPLGAVLGALVALPLAWVAFTDTSLPVRIIWAVVVGAIMGGTIATIVGAALGSHGPADPSAAFVGVPVRVARPLDDEVLRMLVEHEPVRLDVVTDEGTPVTTLATEEELRGDGIFERLRHQFTQDVHGEWDSTQAEELQHTQAVKRDIEHALNEDQSE